MFTRSSIEYDRDNNGIESCEMLSYVWISYLRGKMYKIMIRWSCYILYYEEQPKKRDINYTCAEESLLVWNVGALEKNQMVKIEKYEVEKIPKEQGMKEVVFDFQFIKPYRTGFIWDLRMKLIDTINHKCCMYEFKEYHRRGRGNIITKEY